MKYLFSIVFSIFTALLKAFVIKTFWAWFVISQFPNMPHISMLAAFGFVYLVSVFTPIAGFTAESWEKNLNKTESPGEAFKITMINTVVLAFTLMITLGCGWVIHILM